MPEASYKSGVEEWAMAGSSPSQLVQYVKETLQQGYSEQQVRQTLLQNGYDEPSVDQAFSLARGEGQQKGPARPASSRINRLGVVAIILTFAGPPVTGAGFLFMFHPWLFFVLGGLGVLAAPVALVLGIISLRQIRRRGEKGKGFPIVAVILSGLGVLSIIGLTVLTAMMSSMVGQLAPMVNSDIPLESMPGVERVGPALSEERQVSNASDGPSNPCNENDGVCDLPELCELNGFARMPEFDDSCEDEMVCCEWPY